MHAWPPDCLPAGLQAYLSTCPMLACMLHTCRLLNVPVCCMYMHVACFIRGNSTSLNDFRHIRRWQMCLKCLRSSEALQPRCRERTSSHASDSLQIQIASFCYAARRFRVRAWGNYRHQGQIPKGLESLNPKPKVKCSTRGLG